MESVEVVRQQGDKKNQRLINAITINAYASLVLSWIAFFVTAGVFITSNALTPDKRVFFVSILAVIATGLQIVICVVKSEPVYLLVFSTLITLISALSVGLSVAVAF